MEFRDFQPKELIGKTVLVGNRHGSYIGKIIRVTKTAFEIQGKSGLFLLKNGYLKGEKDVWNFTSAKLITEDMAAELRQKWANEKERRRIISLVEEKAKLLQLPFLQEIEKIINKS